MNRAEASRARGALAPRRWRGAAAAAMLAVLLAVSAAGCGTKPATSYPGPDPAVGPNWPAAVTSIHCPAFIGELDPGGPVDRVGAGEHIPKGFVPLAVVQCVRSVVRIKGRGQWLAVVKRVASYGLGPLISALRKPSSNVHAGAPIDCPMIEVPLPWFELVGYGNQVIQPVVPRESCGQPVSGVLTALANLKWQTVSRTLLERYRAVLDPLNQ
jgi:hypothetical protein